MKLTDSVETLTANLGSPTKASSKKESESENVNMGVILQFPVVGRCHNPLSIHFIPLCSSCRGRTSRFAVGISMSYVTVPKI